MIATEVDALVRSVIVHLGLPFAVLSVIESPAGWDIQVRAGTGGVVRFTVLGGRPLKTVRSPLTGGRSAFAKSRTSPIKMRT
jgi:hypothetical protein